MYKSPNQRPNNRCTGARASDLVIACRGKSRAPVKIVVRSSIHMTANEKTKNRVFAMNFAKVYPLYVAKAERKGRKKSEVDTVICWLTGYSQRELEGQLKKQTNIETRSEERRVGKERRT